jgi:hypothetical protein
LIVRWNEVQNEPNNIGEPNGRPCECGKTVAHEHLEMYAISDGRVMEVKKIQTSGNMVRVWVDA